MFTYFFLRRVQARSRGRKRTGLSRRSDTFAGPGEIKKREVVLDPQVSPYEIKRKEVELGLTAGLLLHQLFVNNGATDIVFVTLFRTAVETATAWCTSCCAGARDTAVTFLFRRRSAASWSSGLARLRSSLHYFFPFPPCPRP